MKFNKDTFEIIFFARAGQGAKTIAEILAQVVLLEKKYVQAFPYYGPTRSGAPTQAYVRISDKEIRTHEPIIDPDVVVVLDETLLKSRDVTKNLTEGESLIINTDKSNDEIRKILKNFRGNIKTVDADSISEDILGQKRANVVILGKLIQITEIVKLKNIDKALKKIFAKKIGKEFVEKNIKAVEAGYDSI